MRKLFMVFSVSVLMGAASIRAVDDKHSFEFQQGPQGKQIRTVTPSDGDNSSLSERQRPIRNPHILGQVVWVDREHEFAVANDVAISPDGSDIFAGWWLNNMRYSSYVSTGIETPFWAFRIETPWMMPVAAKDSVFGGTGSGLPAYIWNHDSPLFDQVYQFPPGVTGGAGISFSGDGRLMATVGAISQTEAILVVYDLNTQDTVFTRHFEPTQGLYGVDLSRDGNMLVVSNYGGLLAYSVPEGNLISELYNYSQTVAKISGDGTLIVSGTFSGAVYLFEYDGTIFDTRYIRSTADDWVTAVAIAADGSTYAGGTLDFENGQISGGKFKMWDATDGSALIDYDEYGDEVGSVGISADGRFAIAGSWGQYAGQFGDVVTCFIRDTDVPIFQLLDDIDEVGSVFSVAISDSGHYATAGGKAVHAREFGNGGMLYSIKINDPLLHDVALASIDEPGEFVSPGEPFTPTATFINVGSGTEDFNTTCTITNLDDNQVVYTASYQITGLTSFATSQVFFSPAYSIPSDGRFQLTFSAEMPADEDQGNNSLSLVLRSWHDIRGIAINSPFNEVTINWSATPSAVFKNMGSYDETFDIMLSIEDSSGAEVYSSVGTIFGLMPYMSEEVAFDGWVPERTGSYSAIFSAIVADDLFPDDNILAKELFVVDEMIYDDGISDASYWVGDYPSSENRKFAQVFIPNIPAPFTVTNAKLFQPLISYSEVFDYAGLAFDDAGLPDTANMLALISFPELPGQGFWAEFDFQTPIAEDLPLWFIVHWPDQSGQGPFIGADATGNIERNSYWYDEANGWNQWLAHDWMIRMTLSSGGSGIEEDLVVGLPEKMALLQNYPNPFNATTRISFALPTPSRVDIRIFNNMGQQVKVFENLRFEAGIGSIIWDGKTDSGDEVSSGVYYYRLEANNHRIARRMVLLK